MGQKLIWAWACLILCASQAHAQAIPSKGAQIIDAPKCAVEIGAGGNLRLSDGQTLQGKCEGGGTSPILGEGGNAIEFKVRSEQTTAKDRSELAFAERRDRLHFGREYLVSFEVNIPTGVAVANSAFYLAQFWQSPIKPPLAGLRIQRGHDRSATIMARDDKSPPQGRFVSAVEFPAEKWVRIAIRIMVKPGAESCIFSSIDAAPEAGWCGSIGYAAHETGLPWYRFKFGIYKGSEPGKQFRVRFRNVSIRGIN